MVRKQIVSYRFTVADGEAYPIRNAILKMIGCILSKELRTELSPTMVNTRNELIDILEERLLDVSAYVRKVALQVWQQLAEERSIPLRYLQHGVDACLSRLQDKSSIVRKQAISFMTSIMTSNPYGVLLKSHDFQLSLAKEETKMKDMLREFEAKKYSQSDDTIAKASKDDTENDSYLIEEKSLEIEKTSFSENIDKKSMESNMEPSQENESTEVKKQRVVVSYLRDAFAFSISLEKAVLTVSQLLGSTITTDVTEAIR